MASLFMSHLGDIGRNKLCCCVIHPFAPSTVVYHRGKIMPPGAIVIRKTVIMPQVKVVL